MGYDEGGFPPKTVQIALRRQTNLKKAEWFVGTLICRGLGQVNLYSRNLYPKFTRRICMGSQKERGLERFSKTNWRGNNYALKSSHLHLKKYLIFYS